MWVSINERILKYMKFFMQIFVVKISEGTRQIPPKRRYLTDY